ncbi:ABC transporter substrate-binding protein [Chitinimonas lacunae]|uniref:ABC transporter substrate-binding protein n=1 Tax=Chitinimonas lacunae TaxID=1963018 RepID=A0ABV8ML52_9NEIS
MHRPLMRLGALCLALTAVLARADLVIGQSAPLSGVAMETGYSMSQGAKAYFSHINLQGGIYGELIRHVVKDDRYIPAETVRNAQSLIREEGAIALVNFYGTGNIVELNRQKILERTGVPLVGVYSGALAAREPHTPWIYHTRAGYHDEVEMIVNMLDDLGVRSVGVLYQNDPFGQAGFEAAKQSLAKHRMTMAGVGTYEQNTDNVAQVAEKFARENPAAILMISITKPTAAFVSRFRAAGGTAQLFNISTANYDQVVYNAGADKAHGLGISQVFPSPFDYRLKLVRDYQDTLKKYAPAEQPGYASFEGYINARVLVEALRRAGRNPSSAAIAKALDSMQDFDLGGYRISFSSQNHIGSRFVELTMINQRGGLSR